MPPWFIPIRGEKRLKHEANKGANVLGPLAARGNSMVLKEQTLFMAGDCTAAKGRKGGKGGGWAGRGDFLGRWGKWGGRRGARRKSHTQEGHG